MPNLLVPPLVKEPLVPLLRGLLLPLGPLNLVPPLVPLLRGLLPVKL
jgi:hypothetical protein